MRVWNGEPYEIPFAKLLHERKEGRFRFFPRQLVLVLDPLYNLRNGMLTVAHLPHISADGIQYNNPFIREHKKFTGESDPEFICLWNNE